MARLPMKVEVPEPVTRRVPEAETVPVGPTENCVVPLASSRNRSAFEIAAVVFRVYAAFEATSVGVEEREPVAAKEMAFWEELVRMVMVEEAREVFPIRRVPEAIRSRHGVAVIPRSTPFATEARGARENALVPVKVWLAFKRATFVGSAASWMEAEGRITPPAVTVRPPEDAMPVEETFCSRVEVPVAPATVSEFEEARAVTERPPFDVEVPVPERTRSEPRRVPEA